MLPLPLPLPLALLLVLVLLPVLLWALCGEGGAVGVGEGAALGAAVSGVRGRPPCIRSRYPSCRCPDRI